VGRFVKIGIPAPAVMALDAQGSWSMAHEARVDWAMLLGSLYLLSVGGGPWSADARLVRPGANANPP
jgi:uncharacterized membrane protein YphA (DoxX/SURF4 family)